MYSASGAGNSTNMSYSLGGASSPSAMAYSSAPGSTTQFGGGYASNGASNNGYNSYQSFSGGQQQQWPFFMSSMPQMGRSSGGQQGKRAFEADRPKQVFMPDYPIVPGYTGHIPGFRSYSAARTFGDATRDTSSIMRSRSKASQQQ